MTHRFILLTTCLLAAAPSSADEWRLMAREGGCFPPGPVLARKVPEAAGIKDPEAFVRLMHSQGREVIREDEPLPVGRLVKVSVPSLGLALGFADKVLCRRFETSGER